MQTNVQRQNEQVYLISNHSASPATAAVSVIISHGRPTGGHIVGGILNRGPADPFLNGRYICFARSCLNCLTCILIFMCCSNLFDREVISYCQTVTAADQGFD